MMPGKIQRISHHHGWQTMRRDAEVPADPGLHHDGDKEPARHRRAPKQREHRGFKNVTLMQPANGEPNQQRIEKHEAIAQIRPLVTQHPTQRGGCDHGCQSRQTNRRRDQTHRQQPPAQPGVCREKQDGISPWNAACQRVHEGHGSRGLFFCDQQHGREGEFISNAPAPPPSPAHSQGSRACG